MLSIAVFNILFLSLIFCHFHYNMSWCGPFCVDPVWNSLCFLNLDVCSLSQVREVFSYYVFKYVLCLFLSSPSWIPIMWMLVQLMLSQWSLKLSSFLFSLWPSHLSRYGSFFISLVVDFSGRLQSFSSIAVL